jgi:hypothetical protein
VGYRVVPVQAVVGIGSRVVGLGSCGCRGSKGSVYTTVVLRIGKGHVRGAVALRIVLLLLLLLLRWIAVGTAVSTQCRRGRPWVHWRRTGAADEQLVVGALRIAVAADGCVSIACSSSVRLVSIIGAWRSAAVRILILAGRTAVVGVNIVGVGYAGVVVVLPIPVVRHGVECARRRVRVRDGCCGRSGIVIHEATWREGGCAGSMTGAAELSVGGFAIWPSVTAMQQKESAAREQMERARMRPTA